MVLRKREGLEGPVKGVTGLCDFALVVQPDTWDLGGGVWGRGEEDGEGGCVYPHTCQHIPMYTYNLVQLKLSINITGIDNLACLSPEHSPAAQCDGVHKRDRAFENFVENTSISNTQQQAQGVWLASGRSAAGINAT